MSFYEIDLTEVQTAGRTVVRQAPDATALAARYLDALADARDTVHHPVVVGALDRYHAAWQPRVNEVAQQIDALGTDTSSAATVLAGSDQDAVTLLAPVGAQAEEQTGMLLRPVNGTA